MMHIVDWYPTLLKLAGASPDQPLPLDGMDVWPTIAQGKPSPRKEILHNLEPRRAAIRRGDWKLISKPARRRKEGVHGPNRIAELFNIADDPFEKTDLASKQPAKVKELLARLEVYAKSAVPPKGLGGGKKPPAFKVPEVWGE